MRRNSRLFQGTNCNVVDSSFGRNISLGQRTTVLKSSISDYSYVGDNAKICHTNIGKFCSIASSVDIGTGSHPSKGYVSSHPAFYLRRPLAGWSFADRDYRSEFSKTIIGNDVWIGSKVVIRDGITIGNGVIIGAGAVVVKDLEPYGIYAGVPAKLIRYRFSTEQIDFLQCFEWWNKDDNWLRSNVESLHDIEAFVSRNRKLL